MGQSLIGNIAVNLAMETADFVSGTTKAQQALGKLQTQMQALGAKWMETGRTLSTKISLPVVGLGAGIIKVASDFESGMNRVSIATKAPTAELEGLRKLAIKIGADTTFGATEAAGAMDMLAKNGLNAKQILEGAAKATVDLASAAGSDLSPAANAITDVMQQFKLTTSQLPAVVNQITGAVNESKLDFVDFAGAISQAGGVAGASGVSFKDFNAVIAGTSSLFASGSDAGTSFKTFITSLSGNSEQASKKIAAMGLRFYDAQGNLRSMGEVAEELRQKLGGLSEEARTSELKGIFGVDAMRTAIGLMDLGADGLDKIAGKIASTNAAAQSSERMKGFAGQLENLKGAVESLAIAIADTGLLTAVTKVVTAMANFVSRLAEANPFLIKLVVGIVALTAAMGPLMLVVGTLAATLLPLFLTRLSPIGIAISAFINPVGTLVAVLSRLVLSFGGMAILETIAPMLLRFLGPVGLIASAGVLIYQNWDKVGPVLSAFWEQAKATLGPPLQELISTVTALFGELWSGPLGTGIRSAITAITGFQSGVLAAFGSVLLSALKLVLQAFTEVITTIASGIRIINAVLQGDWAKAWTLAAGLVNRMLGGLPAYVAGVMNQLVDGIRNAMVTRLNAIWDGVKSKIDTVKGWFFGLYDAVVGHSYIPDMVDGIAQNMARLDNVMVKPVKSATEKAKAAFQKLADDVKPLMEQLFPEARETAEFSKSLGNLQAGINKGGVAGYSVPQLQAAQSRLIAKRTGVEDLPEAVGGGFNAIGDALGDFYGKLGDAVRTTKLQTVQIAQSFKDMARDTLSSLQDLGNSIKSGGFLDIMSSVVNLLLQAGSMGAFGKKIQGNLNAPSIGGARAMGGPVVPGKTYLIGENGPEWATFGAGGQITPMGGGGGAAIRVEAVPNPYFDVRVSQVAGPIAAGAGMHASRDAQGSMMRRARRRLPG